MPYRFKKRINTITSDSCGLITSTGNRTAYFRKKINETNINKKGMDFVAFAPVGSGSVSSLPLSSNS